jgi:hypothetical protein
MDFSTKAILDMFNVHDLRVIAAKLGQSTKYGKRTDYSDDGRSLTQKLKPDLIDIIAGLADIIIMTNPAQQSDDDLNTEFILDKFNIGTLRSFVKHIGKQDEIKTFRRVEKAGKMVSENLNKSELMEKVKPLVRFGLMIKSKEAGIVVPEVKKPNEQDELFDEIEYQINVERQNGMKKAEIIDKIKTSLDDAYNDIIGGNAPINNKIYEILKDKQREFEKTGLSEEKQRVALRKYIREAKKYSGELINTTYEKLSVLATSGAQELLTRRGEERAAPKEQKRTYIKGRAFEGDEIKPRGRPQTREIEPTTLETKTKREIQREKKLEKELEKAQAATEKFQIKMRKQQEQEAKREARLEKKTAKEETTVMKKFERENRKSARAITNT